MIIAIDGNHCVGKTTIIDKLKQYYINNDNVLFYKFPSYTDLGNFARSVVNKESDDVLSLMFTADYYSYFNNISSIKNDQLLILDRYVLSLFVFQGYMKNKDYRFLINLCEHLPKPDVQIVISKKSINGFVETKEDPFVEVFKELNYFDSESVFIVENILDFRENNESGYNQVKGIIDSKLNSLL